MDGDRGPAPQPTAPPAAASLALDDDVLADLLLVADGLLDGRCVTPGGTMRAPHPDGGSSRRVTLALAEPDRAAALAAGALEVSDAEGFTVVRLEELAPEGDLLAGTAHPTDRSGTGPGLAHRLPFLTDGPAAAAPDVVLLARPLLDDDEAALARRVAAGHEVVLVLPVVGPSPDGLPVRLLLRAAERSAQRTGAHLVAATAHRRDPASDAHLLAHLGRALRAGRVVADLPDERRWTALLEEHRTGTGTGAGDPAPHDPGRHDPDRHDPGRTVEAEVRADLARWWPPRSRRGVVVLMTGLSGSGKSTLARALADHVEEHAGRSVSLLDGDHVRRMLSSGLGFGRADRELNVLRIGYVATEVARHGGVAVCAPIAPYASTREAVRRMVRQVGDLVLVHVSTPLAECERRDVKGLYARARAGQIPAFTGISDPYEEPVDADVVVDTSELGPAEALDRVVAHLVEGGWFTPTGRTT